MFTPFRRSGFSKGVKQNEKEVCRLADNNVSILTITNGDDSYTLDISNAGSGGSGASQEQLDLKADKSNTVLLTSLSRGRKSSTTVGVGSFAFGDTVEASYDYTHAEGQLTMSGGKASHAEGSETKATGFASHSEGNNTTASGKQSHAEGSNSTASGDTAHVEGGGCQAGGSYSHAEGQNAQSTGNATHAEGSGTKAIGSNSHAEGTNCQAMQSSAHAEGYGTKAAGFYSHSEGINTLANGQASHAEGYGGSFTVPREGTYTPNAAGIADHVEGYQSRTGQPSTSGVLEYYGNHAEGSRTYSHGGASHSEGCGTEAAGSYSHAEGYTSIAGTHAMAAHAEGYQTEAYGTGSHSGGCYTTAKYRAQHAIGEYNVEDYVAGVTNNYNARGNFVEIVGNGTENERSNARALDWNGNEHLAGDVYVGCGLDSTGGSKLAKESYIASEYDPTATYEIGDYVMHEGVRYRCVRPIEEAIGTWSSSYWEAISVGEEIKAILEDIHQMKIAIIDCLRYVSWSDGHGDEHISELSEALGVSIGM